MTKIVTPAQRRFQAATDLERARQITRENARYGRATMRDQQAVHDAEIAYSEATVQAARARKDLNPLTGWAVINR